MTADAQVALIVGVISAAAALLGALGGTLIGWFLNRKSQMRLEKRAAFVELLTAIDACQIQLIEVGRVIAADDKEGRRREAATILTILGRVDSARTVAALTLSPRHQEVLNRAYQACLADYEKTVKQEPPGRAIHDAWQAVLELGHQELGVSP